MYFIRVCLITCVAIEELVATNLKYEVDHDLTDRTCAASDVSFTSTTPSKIGCAGMCEKELSCDSWFYHQGDRVCSGCTVRYYDVPSLLPSSIGTLYYWSLGTFGEKCSSDRPCRSSLSLNCKNNECDCAEDGFSYNPLTGGCTDGCTNYGSTYRKFSDKSLNTMDIKCELLQPVDRCLNLCSNDSQCRSVNLSPLLTCCLKYATPYTDPAAYSSNALFQPEDLYIRNCREY